MVGAVQVASLAGYVGSVHQRCDTRKCEFVSTSPTSSHHLILIVISLDLTTQSSKKLAG
jgi:hypothetical protein